MSCPFRVNTDFSLLHKIGMMEPKCIIMAAEPRHCLDDDDFINFFFLNLPRSTTIVPAEFWVCSSGKIFCLLRKAVSLRLKSVYYFGHFLRNFGLTTFCILLVQCGRANSRNFFPKIFILIKKYGEMSEANIFWTFVPYKSSHIYFELKNVDIWIRNITVF